MKTYYDILKVKHTASAQEIKKAYRTQSKKYHPDLHGGKKSFEEKFKEIQKAYETLSNPIKKGQYDTRLTGYRLKKNNKGPKVVYKDPQDPRNPDRKKPIYRPKPPTKQEILFEKIIGVAIGFVFLLPIFFIIFLVLSQDGDKDTPMISKNIIRNVTLKNEIAEYMAKQKTHTWMMINVFEGTELKTENPIWKYLSDNLYRYPQARLELTLEIPNNTEAIKKQKMVTLQSYFLRKGIKEPQIKFRMAYNNGSNNIKDDVVWVTVNKELGN